jgi:hypothetical protein
VKPVAKPQPKKPPAPPQPVRAPAPPSRDTRSQTAKLPSLDRLLPNAVRLAQEGYGQPPEVVPDVAEQLRLGVGHLPVRLGDRARVPEGRAVGERDRRLAVPR